MQLEKYEKRTRNNVKEETLNSRMSALRKFNDFIGGEEPNPKDVEEWVDHLIDKHNAGEIKASTIRQYFKHVRYYFETVQGEYESLERIKRFLPDNDVDNGDYLDVDEWEYMRDNTYSFRDKLIINLMYYYGRRPMEVILLNMEDIDLEEDTIMFNILKKKDKQKTEELVIKGRSSFRVFRATFELVPEVKDSLQDWIPYKHDKKEEIIFRDEEKEVEPLITTSQGRISYSTVWKMVKNKSQEAAPDKNITPKSFRHSRATHLYWEGNSPDEIASHQLVHNPDSEVISSYVHEREEDDVRDVMRTEDED